MTSSELRAQHEPILRWSVHTSAGTYARVKRDWLMGPFYTAFFHKFGAYTPKRVCWNFTSMYLAMLQEDNAETLDSPAGITAIAAGRWDFLPDESRRLTPGMGHSIVSVLTDKGLDRLDPQNNTLWIPSVNELTSTLLLLY